MAPDTVFSDRGGYQIPGCSGAKCYRSNAGGAAYGRVTISRALTVSSDAYFYNVGAQFWLQRDRFGGDDGMQNQLAPWGLNDVTGVPLTAEKPGRVPTATWKREWCDRVDCNDGVWRTGDNVNMAIGQGDVLDHPPGARQRLRHLRQRRHALRAPDRAAGRRRTRPARSRPSSHPQVAAQVPLPPEVREPLLEGLAGVPVSGTATRAFAGFPLDQFPVAGKTGTAQVDNKADTAVFAAFGPLPAPQYAISVVLEESGFGGTAAAPVARALFDGLSGTRRSSRPAPTGCRRARPRG